VTDNEMLNSVLSSLRGYPHAGGDIEIMQEVDRLILLAAQQVLDAVKSRVDELQIELDTVKVRQ
jgi:hypothetical protein